MTALEIARAMSPADRAQIIAVAEGFGNMLLVQHKHEADKFVRRYPSVTTTRLGYTRADGQRSRTKRWFSHEATQLGRDVARTIKSRRFKVTWPAYDGED